jgi:hypothetical protein
VLVDSEPEFLATHQEFFNWADIDCYSHNTLRNREQNGRVLVDSEPEFLAPHQEFFNWADIDAILISNYTCMLALPYITEKTGFRQGICCYFLLFLFCMLDTVLQIEMGLPGFGSFNTV